MSPQLGLLDQEDYKIANGDADDKEWKIETTTEAARKSVFNNSIYTKLIKPVIPWQSDHPAPKLRRTAYLDGLRGFAAFIVYWHHQNLWAHDTSELGKILENSFGYEGKHYFACMHGVRTFFTGGHIAVSVFFIISGYVLSAKPLALMQAGDAVKLGDNLASALFRRWLRLFLPLIVTTFLWMTSWHLLGIWSPSVKAERTWWDEFWKWYYEFKNFSFIFRTGGDPWLTYNFHLWSIPVEMKGSIAIYTTAMALSRSAKNQRLLSELALIIYFMWIADGWYGAMFIAGMLLSDLDLLAISGELPSIISRFEPYKDIIFPILFTIGMYLSGVPSHSLDVKDLAASPGWGPFMAWFKPQAVFDYKWFYLFWASVFIVVSIPRISVLKSFFEGRFCQYLGRISFSLYLVHGPVLWTLGDRLYAATGFVKDVHVEKIPNWVNKLPLSHSGPLGLEPAFLLPNLIILPVTFYMAHLVTKYVDDPSVRVTQWLYNKTLVRSTQLKG